MEPLDELQAHIQHLIVLGEKAFESLSTLGEHDQKDGVLQARKKSWQNHLKEIKSKQKYIQELLSSSAQGEINKLDSPLAYFRELPRWLAEGGEPDWSYYYPQINEVMKKIHRTILAIDRKYKLGQHIND